MKARLNQPIDIKVNPSFLLLGLLCIISMFSCLALSLLPMPLSFKLILMTIVIFSTLYYTLRDGLLLLPWSWQQVQVSSSGQLRVINKQGKEFTPDLSAASFIHPTLIILNFKRQKVRSQLLPLPSVILFAASSCNQHRQLRVWTRWWKHAA